MIVIQFDIMFDSLINPYKLYSIKYNSATVLKWSKYKLIMKTMMCSSMSFAY